MRSTSTANKLDAPEAGPHAVGAHVSWMREADVFTMLPVTAIVPTIEAPDAARRAGAAIPDVVTGAVVRESILLRQYPNRRRVVFMRQQEGNGRFKNKYTDEALQSLVGEIQRRPKGWWDHSSIDAIQRGDERSLRDFAAVAVKESVHYDPARGAVLGDIECAPMTAQAIDLAHAAGDSVGVSIEGVGKRRAPGSPDVVGWLNYRGFCLVPEGGAGGMTVREADTPALIHEEHQFIMGLLDTLNPAEVKDANAALYEAIGREYAAAHAAEVVRESAPDAPDAPQLTRLAGYQLKDHVSWPIGLSDGYARTEEPPRACGHITGLRHAVGRPTADLAIHDTHHRPTGETAAVPTGYLRRVRVEGDPVREAAATGGPARNTALDMFDTILGSGRR